MEQRRLLLLSNSKNPGQGYLDHAESAIKDFLGSSVASVLFVPYAGVTLSFDAYAEIVQERFLQMGYRLDPIHTSADPVAAVEKADAIAVGGGNTFHLLYHLYGAEVVEPIRKKVSEGVPYMGWSAGSNAACPTIKTTNDMPIIEPPRFDALNLVPFQINPHYLDTHPEGHGGETREDRINEFIEVNPEVYVVGLREGSILRVEGDDIKLLGEKSMRVFQKGRKTTEYRTADSIEFLLGGSTKD